MTENNLGSKALLSSYKFQCVVAGSQSGNSKRELEADSKEERCFLGLLQVPAQLPALLTQPRPICLKMVYLSGHWALLYQLAIKKMHPHTGSQANPMKAIPPLSFPLPCRESVDSQDQPHGISLPPCKCLLLSALFYPCRPRVVVGVN